MNALTFLEVDKDFNYKCILLGTLFYFIFHLKGMCNNHMNPIKSVKKWATTINVYHNYHLRRKPTIINSVANEKKMHPHLRIDCRKNI